MDIPLINYFTSKYSNPQTTTSPIKTSPSSSTFKTGDQVNSINARIRRISAILGNTPLLVAIGVSTLALAAYCLYNQIPQIDFKPETPHIPPLPEIQVPQIKNLHPAINSTKASFASIIQAPPTLANLRPAENSFSYYHPLVNITSLPKHVEYHQNQTLVEKTQRANSSHNEPPHHTSSNQTLLLPQPILQQNNNNLNTQVTQFKEPQCAPPPFFINFYCC